MILRANFDHNYANIYCKNITIKKTSYYLNKYIEQS